MEQQTSNTDDISEIGEIGGNVIAPNTGMKAPEQDQSQNDWRGTASDEAARYFAFTAKIEEEQCHK